MYLNRHDEQRDMGREPAASAADTAEEEHEHAQDQCGRQVVWYPDRAAIVDGHARTGEEQRPTHSDDPPEITIGEDIADYDAEHVPERIRDSCEQQDLC